MKKAGKFKPDQIKKDTLLGAFEKSKVSFFRYDYPLIDRPAFFEKVKILGIKDLMAMKVDAINTRGTKRDFIDLFFLAKKHSLFKAIEYYQKDIHILISTLFIPSGLFHILPKSKGKICPKC